MEMTRKQESQYKIYFKTKANKKDKGRQYLMLKGSIQGEDVILINIHAPNVRAVRYQTNGKRGFDGNTVTAGLGGFITPFTSKDKSSRQKTNKATEMLNEQYRYI